MCRVLVVSDDLTGANATAAGLAASGLRAVTTRLPKEGTPGLADLADRYDALVVSTGARHLPPHLAAERTRRAIEGGWPARLVSNRIDTTLRGNIGATTAAALTQVARLSGRRAVAVVAPAHPAAGRQTVEGLQLLHGRRLEDTEVARDPRTPVTTSRVSRLLQSQADLRCVDLPISVVTGPAAVFTDRVRTAVESGADVLILDALTVDDLHRGARAVAAADRLLRTPVAWVAVDPGPATAALAEAFDIRARTPPRPLLAVSGSATELTRRQLAHVAHLPEVTCLPAPTGADSAVPDVAATAAAVRQALAERGDGGVVVVATALVDSDVRRVEAETAALIPERLAQAVREAIAPGDIDGLFITGGDVTAAMLKALTTRGLEVHGEIVPLAVAGALVGGPFDGLPVATKGGLVGQDDTTTTCLHALRQAADRRRRLTAPAD